MGVLSAILEVFTSVGTWISTATQNLIPMFWQAGTDGSGGSLTFLGVLAVAGLAFSVTFLIIGLIQRFLHFSG